MTSGVYYINSKFPKIVILTSVENHEVLFFKNGNKRAKPKTFCIVLWQDENGYFPRTLIKGEYFEVFNRLGEGL